jgi:hypothetical protein
MITKTQGHSLHANAYKVYAFDYVPYIMRKKWIYSFGVMRSLYPQRTDIEFEKLTYRENDGARLNLI